MNNILFPHEASDLHSLAKYSTNCPNPILDSEEAEFLYLSEYEKSKSDPTQNWTYRINKYGFRGNLTITPDIKNVGIFGCSVTLGTGVEEKNTFASLVNDQLEMNVINLGVQGSSIQRIAKLIAASIRVIDFDSVVITLPNIIRFIVSDDDDRLICINPTLVHLHVEKKYKAVYGTFSDSDFLYYASDSIQWIISELKCKNIKAYWGSWYPATTDLLKRFLPVNAILPHMRHVDVARDGAHHGIISHRVHANNIVNKYREDGYNEIKNST